MYSSGGNDENTHVNMTITTGNRKELQLQGPRPPPLKVLLKDSIRSVSNKVISKKHITGINHDSRHQFIGRRPKSNLGNQPIVIHLRSPKIIYTQPQDFMDLVQQLTGNHQQQCTEANFEEDDHWKNSDETRFSKDFDSDEGMIINSKDTQDDDQFLELQLSCSSGSSDQGVSTISSLKRSNIFSPVFANTRFVSSPPNTCTNSSNWQDFAGSIF